MNSATRTEIVQNVAPHLLSGEASLLLGAGFSRNNLGILGPLPDGTKLRNELLDLVQKTPTATTTLKDSYLLAKKLPRFEKYIRDRFTVKTAEPWQSKIFKYGWDRIYTTNIDNVLSVAHDVASSNRSLGAAYSFFNYKDPANPRRLMGNVPVVSIHGSAAYFSDGFIFSGSEYGYNSAVPFDWMQELASRIISGGVIVIGNRLDEPDIEAARARRNTIYGNEMASQKNWLILPGIDDIKIEVYQDAGYTILDCTAEEFFTELFDAADKKTASNPQTLNFVGSPGLPAVTWFREAFQLVPLALETAKRETGLLRRFITGATPEWYYISNGAYAEIEGIRLLGEKIESLLNKPDPSFHVLHVVGPSGSGKSAAIRANLLTLSSRYPFIYEYRSENGVDLSMFTKIVESLPDKSILTFYSASEFYYVVSGIFKNVTQKDKRIVFILEDRAHEYQKNRRHIEGPAATSNDVFTMPTISIEDSIVIAQKIESLGFVFDGFSDLDISERAKLIHDRDHGFNGDLLAALFSLTVSENFEDKLYHEYQSLASHNSKSKSILEAITIVHSFGITLPVKYLAGFLSLPLDDIAESIYQELDGMIIHSSSSGRSQCRHRVIAEYYFKDCIARKGDPEFILSMIRYLSRQFTVSDIKHHPISYQIYKRLINCNFLLNEYFPNDKKFDYALQVYNEAQKYYALDGIFWLQFGRLYRKMREYSLAIDCFKNGIEQYEDSFQLRHSLGLAYLERFLYSDIPDDEDLDEGITILEREDNFRGGSDPYPLSALCETLIKIRSKYPSTPGIDEKLKSGINRGLELYRWDTHFQRVVADYRRI